jgi:RimJ/RimL family protein N-acetyltransferase
MDLKFVKCESKYYEFIRELRVHPENSQGFIVQGDISIEEQKRYMEKNEKFFFVCLDNEEPVGFVGVIEDDIRVATSPKHKKMGIGKFMINEVMKLFPNAKAKIKIENEASIALFESCGFKTEFLIMKK